MPLTVLLASVLALAYLAPWPWLVNGAAPLVGDPNIYAFNADTVEWAHRSLFLGLFAVVTAYLWRVRDVGLALVVAVAGLQSFVLGPHIISGYLLLGVGAVLGGRQLTERQRRCARWWLGASAVVQSLLVLGQYMTSAPPIGTLGVAGLAGAYIALAALAIPAGWTGDALLVVCGAGVAATSSRAALLALLLGVALRYRSSVTWLTATVITMVAVMVVLVALAATHASGSARVEVWRLAARDMRAHPWSTIAGFGLGAWTARIPAQQLEQHVALDGSIGPNGTGQYRYFTTAHNDLAQWVYETGLLGCAALAVFLARQRRLLLVPSLAALAVLSLAWFPFHDLRTGILAALMIGIGGSPMNEGA